MQKKRGSQRGREFVIFENMGDFFSEGGGAFKAGQEGYRSESPEKDSCLKQCPAEGFESFTPSPQKGVPLSAANHCDALGDQSRIR